MALSRKGLSAIHSLDVDHKRDGRCRILKRSSSIAQINSTPASRQVDHIQIFVGATIGTVAIVQVQRLTLPWMASFVTGSDQIKFSWACFVPRLYEFFNSKNICWQIQTLRL